MRLASFSERGRKRTRNSELAAQCYDVRTTTLQVQQSIESRACAIIHCPGMAHTHTIIANMSAARRQPRQQHQDRFATRQLRPRSEKGQTRRVMQTSTMVNSVLSTSHDLLTRFVGP
eukprot:scpid98723/ scgid22445/ 